MKYYCFSSFIATIVLASSFSLGSNASAATLGDGWAENVVSGSAGDGGLGKWQFGTTTTGAMNGFASYSFYFGSGSFFGHAAWTPVNSSTTTPQLGQIAADGFGSDVSAPSDLIYLSHNADVGGPQSIVSYRVEESGTYEINGFAYIPLEGPHPDRGQVIELAINDSATGLETASLMEDVLGSDSVLGAGNATGIGYANRVLIDEQVVLNEGDLVILRNEATGTGGFVSQDISVTLVPEPASVMLVCFGGLAFVSRGFGKRAIR